MATIQSPERRLSNSNICSERKPKPFVFYEEEDESGNNGLTISMSPAPLVAPATSGTTRDTSFANIASNARKPHSTSPFDKDHPNRCPKCFKTFCAAGNMRRHYLTHFPPTYECEFKGCRKKFVSQYNRTVHHRTHAHSGPVTCPVVSCGETFKQRRQLTTHMRSAHRSKEHTPAPRKPPQNKSTQSKSTTTTTAHQNGRRPDLTPLEFPELVAFMKRDGKPPTMTECVDFAEAMLKKRYIDTNLRQPTRAKLRRFAHNINVRLSCSAYHQGRSRVYPPLKDALEVGNAYYYPPESFPEPEDDNHDLDNDMNVDVSMHLDGSPSLSPLSIGVVPTMSVTEADMFSGGSQSSSATSSSFSSLSSSSSRSVSLMPDGRNLVDSRSTMEGLGTLSEL